MKIRQGFVSNSSTSSFILASSRDDLKVKITVEVDLKEMANTIIKTEEQLESYYRENWGYPLENKGLIKDYNIALKAIKEGKTVYIIDVSNDYGGIQQLIYDDSGLLKGHKGIDVIGND